MRAKAYKEKHKSEKSPPRSPFTTGTVELVLHFLPVDDSPDGRRILHMLSLNGKMLALGTHRARELPDLLTSLGELSPEEILARLEKYVIQRQQQIKESETRRLQAKKALTSGQASSVKLEKSALPLLDASTAPPHVPAASPVTSQAQTSLSNHPVSQRVAEVPQQLSLF